MAISFLKQKPMIGGSFYQQTAFMPAGIEFLSKDRCGDAGAGQFCYADPFSDKTRGVEMKDQFIQPGDKEALKRFALCGHGHLPGLRNTIQLRDEAEHADTGIGKELRQILAEGTDAGVTEYVKNFKLLHHTMRMQPRITEVLTKDSGFPGTTDTIKLLLILKGTNSFSLSNGLDATSSQRQRIPHVRQPEYVGQGTTSVPGSTVR